ncbi:hypothetical protein HID58_059790 [Brassica napus]|uniref:Uncharacterized protein n=1 Tax=Brassica napus TaxID=3708 RepID=A0ABQ7ZTW0_BRANA|nr:hypothetical protein HID58_059790 [Brassica napus]
MKPNLSSVSHPMLKSMNLCLMLC